MATSKNPVSSDSDATLRDLIGEDASATFESDPNFVESDAGAHGSSYHVSLRDTDDTENSEEEEEEAFEDDDEEVEDEDDEDEDEEDDDDDDEDEEDEETDDDVLRMAEPTNVHGPGKHDRADIEEELEEMEEETGEPDEAESVEETEEDSDDPRVERGIDAALRMRAMVAAGSEFAANLRGMGRLSDRRE
jgi:hypothetical protein